MKLLEVQVTQIEKLPSDKRKREIDIEILEKERILQEDTSQKKSWFQKLFDRETILNSMLSSDLSGISLEELKAKKLIKITKMKMQNIFIRIMPMKLIFQF